MNAFYENAIESLNDFDDINCNDEIDLLEQYDLSTDSFDKMIYPIIPLKNQIIFPSTSLVIFVAREKSIAAIDAAVKNSGYIFAVLQKNSIDEPSVSDICDIGVLCRIRAVIAGQDGVVSILLDGEMRAEVVNFFADDIFDSVEVNISKVLLKDNDENAELLELKAKLAHDFLEIYIREDKHISNDLTANIRELTDVEKLIDAITLHTDIDIHVKQQVLESQSLLMRAKIIYNALSQLILTSETKKKITNTVQSQIDKSQKEFFLHEQMKAIQKELGNEKDEFHEFEAKISTLHLSQEAREKAQNELNRLKQMSPMSSEASISRTYLEWLLSVPWHVNCDGNYDLKTAEEILNKEHYGLEEVKERILEYISVQNRIRKPSRAILCLIGPPGVGKTSLVRSIAHALDRPFAGIALGGVYDESDIRGHKKTYIGAMPGKLIAAMKKTGVSNPVILLDEIDKLRRDLRGDPSSALLEALDPEQNSTFQDHYLDIGYDISKVVFVCTANGYEIDGPLLDRLEVIRLSGYTEDEKIVIAEKYLVPEAVKSNGLKDGEFSIEKDALVKIIREYTREAGVRSLEREISKLARKAVKKIVLQDAENVNFKNINNHAYNISDDNIGNSHIENDDDVSKSPPAYCFTITSENLQQSLGIPVFESSKIERKNMVGIVRGLAWTEMGGETLSIEAVVFQGGKGNIKITGNIGKVMHESAEAARSIIFANAEKYGVTANMHEVDIHVHVPEGATPKDGPSAGVAMMTCILSALKNQKIRSNIGMTGEISFRGDVLQIGGLKEKILAAVRDNLNTIIIPKSNVKDLEKIPKHILDTIKIIAVTSVDEVVAAAMIGVDDAT